MVVSRHCAFTAIACFTGCCSSQTLDQCRYCTWGIYVLYRALVSSSYCSVVVKYMYVRMWWEYIQCTCRTLLSVHCTVGMVCSDLFRGWRTRGFPPWLATHPWKFPTIIIVFKILSFWFVNVVSEATRSSLRCCWKFSWGSMPPDPYVTTSYNFSPLTKNSI